MQENPFSGILQVLRKDNDERKNTVWRLGLVVAVDPLTIRTDGLDLTGSDLLVNYQLQQNAETVELSNVAGVLTGNVDCSNGSITSMSVSGGTIAAQGAFGGVLAVNDQVVMLASDDQQQFVVLCKVVGG